MARRHVYRENWIIEFSSTYFQAFILNQDDEVEEKTFRELSKAKKIFQIATSDKKYLIVTN